MNELSDTVKAALITVCGMGFVTILSLSAQLLTNRLIRKSEYEKIRLARRDELLVTTASKVYGLLNDFNRAVEKCVLLYNEDTDEKRSKRLAGAKKAWGEFVTYFRFHRLVLPTETRDSINRFEKNRTTNFNRLREAHEEGSVSDAIIKTCTDELQLQEFAVIEQRLEELVQPRV